MSGSRVYIHRMAPLSKEQESRLRKAEKAYRVSFKQLNLAPDDDDPDGKNVRRINKLADKSDQAMSRLRGTIAVVERERDQDEDYLVWEFQAYLPERSTRTKKKLRDAALVRVLCSDKKVRELRVDEIFLIDSPS